MWNTVQRMKLTDEKIHSDRDPPFDCVRCRMVVSQQEVAWLDRGMVVQIRLALCARGSKCHFLLQ